MPPNRFSTLERLEDVRLEMVNLPQQQEPNSQSHVLESGFLQEEDSETNPTSPYALAEPPPSYSNLAEEQLEIQPGSSKQEESTNPSLGIQEQSWYKNKATNPRGSVECSDVHSENTSGSSSGDADTAGILKRPAIWDRGHDYVYMPKPTLGPWETVKQGLNKYDKNMCDAWNDELNTILTFAGLFSAAVTAFCIESFQSLSQNPAEITNNFLVIISQQLANSSSPVANLSTVDAFTPQTSNVQINVLYFMSLTLALSVSSVCILAKQWIREYQKDISVSPCDAARVRQARFDSLEAWKVPQIIGALPVILLAALMMFFSGLLIQLWNVNNYVTAATVTVVTAFTVLFVLATTVVPALVSARPSRSSFAPFRSPQAWIFFYAYRQLQHWYHRTGLKDRSPVIYSWDAFDQNFLKVEGEHWFGQEISSVHRVLRWVSASLNSPHQMKKALFWCMLREHHPENLKLDENKLSRHVLHNYNADKNISTTRNVNRIYYDYSKSDEGPQFITEQVGRHQVEMLIRSACHVFDNADSSHQEIWDAMQYLCENLDAHCLLYQYQDQDIVHHQHILQDQLALVFERIFWIDPSPPSPLFDWSQIIQTLSAAQHYSSSPLLLQVSQHIAKEQFPAWIRQHVSATLLSRIGWAFMQSVDMPRASTNELFTHLDHIMVEWCGSSAENGWSDRSDCIEDWKVLRMAYTSWTQERRFFSVPGHLRLPHNHFDRLPGHGPLVLAKNRSSSTVYYSIS